MYIVDLPGYGYAKAPETLVRQWQEVLKKYLRGRPNLRRVFLLIDSRHGIKKEDIEIMNMLDVAAVSYQIVLTKTDKISSPQLAEIMQKTSAETAKHAAAMPDIVTTSSEKKIGLDILKTEICALL